MANAHLVLVFHHRYLVLLHHAFGYFACFRESSFNMTRGWGMNILKIEA